MHDNSHGELCQFQTLLTLPSAWLIDTLLSPYQVKKGARESTQAMLVSYVMSAKRHCQMLVWGTVTNPKSSPLTGVQYVSMHCVLILVLGYITLKRDYTSEIMKIARLRFEANSKRCSTCSNRCSTCLKRQPNQSGII